MKKTVRLVHWNEDEGLERQQQLEAFGFDAAFEFGDGLFAARQIKASPPDAVVIDLSRLPSHGREVAQSMRSARATRHVPIVFVGGEPDKVEKTRLLMPDATFTTWARIKTALPKAIATPVALAVVPSHQVYNTPTVAKLGVKPGSKVALVGSPKGFAETLAPWPANVRLTARPEKDADLYICFAKALAEVQAHLVAVRDAGRQTLWLAWPKKASGVKTDLDGNVVRETGLRAGWVDFKVCAINDTWSGLAFKKRKKEPASFLRKP
jgi:CheY-like chemotaxis protein